MSFINSFLRIGVLFTGFLVLGCNNSSQAGQNDAAAKDSYVLKGTIRTTDSTLALKPFGHKLVSLYQITDAGTQLLDSTRTNAKGEYRFTGRLQEEELGVISFQGFELPVDLRNGEEGSLNIDVGAQGIPVLKASGSKGLEVMSQAMAAHFEFNRGLSQKREAYNIAATGLNDAGRDSLARAIQQDMQSLVDQRESKLQQLIKEGEKTLVPYFIVTQMIEEPSIALQEQVYAGMAKNLPGHKYTKALDTRIKEEKPLAVGSEVPEIALAGENGEPIKLSSLRGKYVLIDFWASWCRPCRMENPNNVRLYNAYKDKGFEIYGVSLDNDKNAWAAAIKKDGLTWMHVSDLKGWQSAAARQFKVTSIPYTVLVDPQGRIVAKNLRGEALAVKLAALFN